MHALHERPLLCVAIGAIPDAYLTPESKQLVKFIAVSASMIGFFKWYRFGKWDPKFIGISIAAAPMAIFLWILPLYFMDGRGGAGDNFSTMYFTLRMFNSTLLVAIFEELFIRKGMDFRDFIFIVYKRYLPKDRFHNPIYNNCAFMYCPQSMMDFLVL